MRSWAGKSRQNGTRRPGRVHGENRRDNPLANGGENTPSAGHSGASRLHEKEWERNESGQAFRYNYFFGMQSDTPVETLSRYRYLKKESPESKSREERWPDRKIPIRRTRYTKHFRRMSFLTFPAEYDSGPTEQGVFSGKRAIIYFHVPGRYSMAFFGSDRGDSRQRSHFQSLPRREFKAQYEKP